jgi:hypothetical protein
VLRRLIDGYQVSQAIHVAATLGIADLLAGGARASGDLAARRIRMRCTACYGRWRHGMDAWEYRAVSPDPGVAARCRTMAGSFFEGVPAGGDAYVLHDWDDAQAVAILRSCRAAMGDDATLLIIERDLGPPNELPGPKVSDVNMLVGQGGQERTIHEYADLMHRAGLRLIAGTPGPFDLHIIEGGPA